MNIAIIGSRDFVQLVRVRAYVFGLPLDTHIISGGAIGVDKTAERAAIHRKMQLTVLYPNYTKYGFAATHIRNDEILAIADEVVAFWDGISRGTKSIIDKCTKPLTVFT